MTAKPDYAAKGFWLEAAEKAGQETRNRGLAWIVGWALVVCILCETILALQQGAWGSLFTRTHHIDYLTPDQSALTQAETGVGSNGEWTPIMSTFEGVQMVLVPAGCYMMGSEDGYDDEQPVHEVCFDEPFWIDMYEVTNAQYGSSGRWLGDNRPRESVSWRDAVVHCESRGARLPTEAEWEYATRGPDGTVYPWGDSFVADNAVHWDNSHRQTAAVGSRPDGASWIGAMDMIGNVEEWVADWYGTYPSEAQVNPSGPDSGDYRVLRGGSWATDPFYLRGALRIWYVPDLTIYDNGFRCARDY
jgi:formylglycine-generating enzyme required for sulfatase activity